MMYSTIAVLAALLSAFCVALAYRAADLCDRHAKRLGNLRGNVFELEGALAQLANQHRKLEGRFYGTLGAARARIEETKDAIETPQPSDVLVVCENWSKAQKTGPKSDAASCQCDYCVAMRELRHNVKAALVPKSNAARIDAIKRGLAQPQ
jgi:hypothetical protein